MDLRQILISTGDWRKQTAMTHIGKYREILVVYYSAREARVLMHQDLHQDLSEVPGQREVSKEILTWDNGKKRWFRPSIFPTEKSWTKIIANWIGWKRMFVQWAGQKWESISEYLITECSGMVIMKGFGIEGLSDAPDTWGHIQTSMQKPKQKGELNKTRLKLPRSEKIHKGDATALEAGKGFVLSLISI